jgi:hypothetical protein
MLDPEVDQVTPDAGAAGGDEIYRPLCRPRTYLSSGKAQVKVTRESGLGLTLERVPVVLGADGRSATSARGREPVARPHLEHDQAMMASQIAGPKSQTATVGQ